MANITAQMVKELRERTGAGMMDCKAALQETAGDMEQAVDLLRKKGLAKAAKKAGRIAAEGLIGLAVEGTEGRSGRGQFRDRFRRAQRSVPGPGEDDRQCRAHGRDRRREDQGGQGRQHHRRRGDRRHHRQDRREHDAAAGGVAFGRQGRHRQLCAQLGRRGPRQDRRPGGAGSRPARPTSSSASAAWSRCMSPPPIRRRSIPPVSIRMWSGARRMCSPTSSRRRESLRM